MSQQLRQRTKGREKLISAKRWAEKRKKLLQTYAVETEVLETDRDLVVRHGGGKCFLD